MGWGSGIVLIDQGEGYQPELLEVRVDRHRQVPQDVNEVCQV